MQLSFSSSCWLMRILGAVIQPSSAFMLGARNNASDRGGGWPPFVRDDRCRCHSVPFHEAAQQFDSCSFVPPRLQQHIQYLTFIVHGSPEIHLLSAGPDEDLINMPCRTRPRPSILQPVRIGSAEFLCPPADCFIGNVDAALSQ